MATLYGSGKGLVRLMAGLEIMIGILLFVFGIVCATLICHWTSKAGLGIWIGIIVSLYMEYFDICHQNSSFYMMKIMAHNWPFVSFVV